ncbi:hypothetical protein SAMN04487788_1690 [Microbacterium testaceum StLB037]|uniref:Uncharacterized protein n=1 Tax=Microbacterium testaceum (strain StLB037) TaxID=979556 RepID=A0A1H0P262_MICTS|nr:hypothetical protein [Microbacterium testaceum]SDO98818.1 hypothetical protein SAMN04487788_1690 [Microbacterium testaceum StLB037]
MVSGIGQRLAAALRESIAAFEENGAQRPTPDELHIALGILERLRVSLDPGDPSLGIAQRSSLSMTVNILARLIDSGDDQ